MTAAGSRSSWARGAGAALADSIAFDRTLSGTDTREVAREWIQDNVPAGSLIAVENYTAPLVLEEDLDHYRAAGLEPVAYEWSGSGCRRSRRLIRTAIWGGCGGTASRATCS